MINGRKKPQRRILVVNCGETGDFPSKIEDYLQKYTTTELKDIKNFQVGEFEAEVQNYHKSILICKTGQGLRLYQERIMNVLDKKIQKNVRILYMGNQGAGFCFVPDSRIWHALIFPNQLDEESLNENLKNFIYSTSSEKWMSRINPLLFIVILLFLGFVCGYSCRGFVFKEPEGYEKVETKVNQISQNETDRIQVSKNLIEDKIKMNDDIYVNEHKDGIKNEEPMKKLEVIQKERNFLSLEQTDQMKLEEKQKEASVNEIREAIQKGNLELKELFARNEEKRVSDEKKLVAHKFATKEGVSNARNLREQIERELGQNIKRG